MNWLKSFSVYLKSDVLIVMLMGFAAGLPLALSGSTLSIWLTESGESMKTIGLFAALGTPYSLKFLWSPFIDAFRVPFLSKIGHRKSWLLLFQILLIFALIIMSFLNPKADILLIAITAFLIAFLSASQDIVVDTYRIETLPVSEQAAGVASYIAAYRVAMLISGAGFLFLVSYLEKTKGFSLLAAWQNTFLIMAGLMALCILATLFAREKPTESEKPSLTLVFKKYEGAFKDFLTEKNIVALLGFILIFKLCDALAGNLTAPFVISLGFERVDYAAIVKGVGFAATLIGGFAGGALAVKISMQKALFIALILQMLSNLGFAVLALAGKDFFVLTIVIIIENFTGAIGSVIFVAFLSSLCKNPLHTATQYALLSSLTAVARTQLAAFAGFFQVSMGWTWFFIFTAVSALPAFFLLFYLRNSIEKK